MVVGMTTVVVILLLVIYLGKGLIAAVNKYAPEEADVKRQILRPQPQAPIREQIPAPVPDEVPGAAIAAVVSAISLLTGGKGKVIKIEKQ